MEVKTDFRESSQPIVWFVQLTGYPAHLPLSHSLHDVLHPLSHSPHSAHSLRRTPLEASWFFCALFIDYRLCLEGDVAGLLLSGDVLILLLTSPLLSPSSI